MNGFFLGRYYLRTVLFLMVFLIENSFASEIEITRVFLDCNFCDENFIKNEIEFVDWVRDRKDANVHILVTRQRLGNGGSYISNCIFGQKFDKQ